MKELVFGDKVLIAAVGDGWQSGIIRTTEGFFVHILFHEAGRTVAMTMLFGQRCYKPSSRKLWIDRCTPNS